MAKNIKFGDLQEVFKFYLADNKEYASFEDYLIQNNLYDSKKKKFHAKMDQKSPNEIAMTNENKGKFASFLEFVNNNKDRIVSKDYAAARDFINKAYSESNVKIVESDTDLESQLEDLDNDLSHFNTKFSRKNGSWMKKAGIPAAAVAVGAAGVIGVVAGLGLAAGAIPFIVGTTQGTIVAASTVSVAAGLVGVGVSQVITNGYPRNYYNLRYGRHKILSQVKKLDKEETMTSEQIDEQVDKLGISKLMDKFEVSNAKKFGKHRRTNRDRLHEIMNVYNQLNDTNSKLYKETPKEIREALSLRIASFLQNVANQDQDATTQKSDKKGKKQKYVYGDIIMKGLVDKKDRFTEDKLIKAWDNLRSDDTLAQENDRLENRKTSFGKEDDKNYVNKVGKTKKEKNKKASLVGEAAERHAAEATNDANKKPNKHLTEQRKNKATLADAKAVEAEENHKKNLEVAYKQYKIQHGSLSFEEFSDKMEEYLDQDSSTSVSDYLVAALDLYNNEKKETLINEEYEKRQEQLRAEVLEDAYAKYVGEYGGINIDPKDKEAIKNSIRQRANKEGKSYTYAAKELAKEEQIAQQKAEQIKKKAQEVGLDSAYTKYKNFGGSKPADIEYFKNEIQKIVGDKTSKSDYLLAADVLIKKEKEEQRKIQEKEQLEQKKLEQKRQEEQRKIEEEDARLSRNAYHYSYMTEINRLAREHNIKISYRSEKEVFEYAKAHAEERTFVAYNKAADELARKDIDEYLKEEKKIFTTAYNWYKKYLGIISKENGKDVTPREKDVVVAEIKKNAATKDLNGYDVYARELAEKDLADFIKAEEKAKEEEARKAAEADLIAEVRAKIESNCGKFIEGYKCKDKITIEDINKEGKNTYIATRSKRIIAKHFYNQYNEGKAAFATFYSQNRSDINNANYSSGARGIEETVKRLLGLTDTDVATLDEGTSV